MDNTQRTAFILSQTACMNARLAAMQAQNTADRDAGRPATHLPDEFVTLPDHYGLGHNAVLTYLQGG